MFKTTINPLMAAVCDSQVERFLSFTKTVVFLASVLTLVMFLMETSIANAQEPTPSSSSRRPNIIFLFADDQPANCLGIMGNKAIQTPHTDALGQNGVVFQNAFVTTAICCSNRACLLTGQHMYRHGIEDFKEPLSSEAFDQTYPALLRQSGYRVGFMGKYAIGNPSVSKDLSLPSHKFDDWYGFSQSIEYKQEIDGQPRYLTEVMTKRAISFLRSNPAEQPFCLVIAFKEPHGTFNYFDPDFPNIYEGVELPKSPTFSRKDFESQPEFIQKSLNADSARKSFEDPEKYQNDLRTFYRTVTRADAAVGEIVDELQHLNLDDNTVVIYSSDHGSLLGDHGLTGKWLMYENSIRVPLIIYDPRLDPKHNRSQREEIALSIDLAPTMLELAGVEIPSGMQGHSLVPVLNNQTTSWREHYYYEHTFQTDPPRSPIPASEGIRTARWKYIRYPQETPVYEQLFDLAHDPLEQTNLIEDSTAQNVLKELRSLCDHAKDENIAAK